jgi:hypothetical protein
MRFQRSLTPTAAQPPTCSFSSALGVLSGKVGDTWDWLISEVFSNVISVQL